MAGDGAARTESLSGGSTVLQTAIAFGQRGWKRQPDGGLQRARHLAGDDRARRRASTSGSATGIAASSASV